MLLLLLYNININQGSMRVISCTASGTFCKLNLWNFSVIARVALALVAFSFGHLHTKQQPPQPRWPHRMRASALEVEHGSNGDEHWRPPPNDFHFYNTKTNNNNTTTTTATTTQATTRGRTGTTPPTAHLQL